MSTWTPACRGIDEPSDVKMYGLAKLYNILSMKVTHPPPPTIEGNPHTHLLLPLWATHAQHSPAFAFTLTTIDLASTSSRVYSCNYVAFRWPAHQPCHNITCAVHEYFLQDVVCSSMNALVKGRIISGMHCNCWSGAVASFMLQEFHRRLAGRGIESFAAHPGIAKTEIFPKLDLDARKPFAAIMVRHVTLLLLLQRLPVPLLLPPYTAIAAEAVAAAADWAVPNIRIALHLSCARTLLRRPVRYLLCPWNSVMAGLWCCHWYRGILGRSSDSPRSRGRKQSPMPRPVQTWQVCNLSGTSHLQSINPAH